MISLSGVQDFVIFKYTKTPTIAAIFSSNRTIMSFKNNRWHFKIYDWDKLHAYVRLAIKNLITPGPGINWASAVYVSRLSVTVWKNGICSVIYCLKFARAKSRVT